MFRRPRPPSAAALAKTKRSGGVAGTQGGAPAPPPGSSISFLRTLNDDDEDENGSDGDAGRPPLPQKATNTAKRQRRSGLLVASTTAATTKNARQPTAPLPLLHRRTGAIKLAYGEDGDDNALDNHQKQRLPFSRVVDDPEDDDYDDYDDPFAPLPAGQRLGYGGSTPASDAIRSDRGTPAPMDGNGDDERRPHDDSDANDSSSSSAGGGRRRRGAYDPDSLSRLRAEQRRPTRFDPNPLLAPFGDDGDEAVLDRPPDWPAELPTEVVPKPAPDDWSEPNGPGIIVPDGPWPPQALARVPSPRAAPAFPSNIASEDRGNGRAKLVSLDQLKVGLTATLSQITQQAERDRDDRLPRLFSRVEELRREASERDAQVREAGRAAEYYQRLRPKLVDWVGALRQLKRKVVPLQTAVHDLQAEVAGVSRRREWERDAIGILYRHDKLDRVLGHQPDDPRSLFDPLQALPPQVDEFGRDMESQADRQRTQRVQKRRRIRDQRAPTVIRGDESDAFRSDDESETLRERHAALLEALEVARLELDDDFIHLQKLVDLFDGWRTEFPDDYRECRASLSLADLASVLILAELCALNDPWNESGGYNEGKWIAVVKSAADAGTLDDAGVERILERAVYPSVNDLLHRTGYALVSARQSRALSSFVQHVRKVTPNEGGVWHKLLNLLVGYISGALSDISIPIVRSDVYGAANAPVISEDLEEAIDGATVGQMHYLQKLLLNVIKYWGPVLGTDPTFAEALLDFISHKFLFLLSSLQRDASASRFSESPADAFREVWDALEPTGWLHDPNFMIQTLALRAAHTVYCGTETAPPPGQ